MKKFFCMAAILLTFLFTSCAGGNQMKETESVLKTQEPTPAATEDTFSYPEEKQGIKCGYIMENYVSKNSPSQTIKGLARGEEKTIVAYGTSLTEYTGYANDLKTIFEFKYPDKATVINSGKGASDSNWGRENVESFVADHNPDMVIIEFSINDAFLERSISLGRSKENLLYMVERIRRVNPECEIVLMTMDMPLGIHFDTRPDVEDYYELYRKTAEEEGFFLVDNISDWKELLAEGEEEYLKLVPDGIHPSQQGHRKITVKNLLNVLYGVNF